jgi:hypothetical protein
MKRIVLILVCLGFLLAMGCTEGSSLGARVGNSCDADRDCAPGSDCLRGGDFPGGFCTHECDSDRDCPDYASCVGVEGGVCLISCVDHRDCPPDYECDDRSREGHPGRTRVCLGE